MEPTERESGRSEVSKPRKVNKSGRVIGAIGAMTLLISRSSSI